MNITSVGYYISLKKGGYFNQWVVTLVAGDSGYEKFILVLEVNCISSLHEAKSYFTTDNPQWASHYNYIWCFCGDFLTEMFSGYYICKIMVVIDVLWYMWGDLFQRCIISGYYIYKIEVVEGLGSFLSGCLMQLANKQYITTVSSACLQPW